MASDDGAHWDEVAGQADALPAGWRRHAREAHLELLHRWVGTPAGRWLKTDLFEERDATRALLPHVPTAAWVGTDISPATVRGAQSGSAGSASALVAADVRRLPFAGATFDGVLSTSTLDHFDDRASIVASLAELRRVLRAGGTLVLTLDNPANPLVRARNALPHRVARRTGLVPFAVGETLDEPTGRRVLTEQGFDVVDTCHLLHAPHVVGTRAARFRWWERTALPTFDRLGGTRWSRFSGHFVAFLARAGS